MKVQVLEFDNKKQALRSPGGTLLAPGTLVRRLQPANSRPHQLVASRAVTHRRQTNTGKKLAGKGLAALKTINKQLAREKSNAKAAKAYQEWFEKTSNKAASKTGVTTTGPRKTQEELRKELQAKLKAGKKQAATPKPLLPRKPITKAKDLYLKKNIPGLATPFKPKPAAAKTTTAAPTEPEKPSILEDWDYIKRHVEERRPLYKKCGTWESCCAVLLILKGEVALKEAREFHNQNPFGYHQSIYYCLYIL